MAAIICLCVFSLAYFGAIGVKGDNGIEDSYRLKVLTVALQESDGCSRFLRSANLFNLDVDVIGLNDGAYDPDNAGEELGGYQIQLVRERLEKYKDQKDLIVLFADGCSNSMMTTGADEIISKFLRFKANIVLSAAEPGTPDYSVSSEFPIFAQNKQVSSSGMMIGFAPLLHDMISREVGSHSDDPQIYLTQIYLGYREMYVIKLDWRAELFQTNPSKQHTELKFNGSDVRLINIQFGTEPSVVNSATNKLYLNHISNYVPHAWNYVKGCISCDEDMIRLGGRLTWPSVLIGVFVTHLTPFMDSFLQQISNLDYPKNKLSIFLYNNQEYHANDVADWVRRFKDQYKLIKIEGPSTQLDEADARNMGLQETRNQNVEFYFSLDSIVSLRNRDALRYLIQQNRPILAPILTKITTLWSNFWCDVREDGYYQASPDCQLISKFKRWHVWNVPYVTHAYLIKSNVVDKIGPNPFYSTNEEDLDVEFCRHVREKGVFMYATNMEHYGHLKELKSFTTEHKNNDLYQGIDNKIDWEEKYLHPQYRYYLTPESPKNEPCFDVFWVPIVTRNFTKALVEECEHNGNWSDGTHNDARVEGGYENVPTVDIHMKQLGFEKHWLYMLQEYFAPMATRVFAGYYSKSRAYMNFVVKYTPSGQYFLRPHHDESTYTVNLALNEPGVDYEGGGARFVRTNCSVSDTKVGWALLHPGRLTHWHEGLPTTKGTRYIMISFVDP